MTLDENWGANISSLKQLQQRVARQALTCYIIYFLSVQPDVYIQIPVTRIYLMVVNYKTYSSSKGIVLFLKATLTLFIDPSPGGLANIPRRNR